MPCARLSALRLRRQHPLNPCCPPPQTNRAMRSGKRPAAYACRATKNTPPSGKSFYKHFGLPLSLVLGVVQVESAFRKYAISSAGARGYMQVMPFWARLIGDGDDSRLFHMQTNLRFGCVILRHLLDRERGDLFMGLGRYNGSRGQAAYPQAVLSAQRLWMHPAD
eukprot:gene26337-32903_t